MPRRALAAACAVLAGAAGAALSAPPTALPTTASKLTVRATTRSYPRFDAAGRRAGSAGWLVTTAGGNCCEVLLAATRTGRLLEFGGTYPLYSDDRGRTWTEIAPTAPSTSRLDEPTGVAGGGEGTIVMAPAGDLVGVGWDAYSGDRLQSFLYDASHRKWYYQETVLHEPFYDRPWVAVAKGPFTIAGQTVPWVSLVLTDYTRNAVLMSLDGLSYFTPTSRELDAVRNGRVERYLPVQRDAELDYLQEHSETAVVSLAGGGALSFDPSTGAGCGMQLLQRDGSWACFAVPAGELHGRLHVDSRGWLHDVTVDGDDVTYRISRDGGRSWTTSTFAVPGGVSVESWDFKAHGALARSAIAVHARKTSGTTQDMVLRVDTRSARARLVDTLHVGAGDLASTEGLDPLALVLGTDSHRFDFSTVAILPDGAIAVGFADKAHDDPAVAVLR